MKLIVGVGNPGSAYARTRLNAGYIVIDKIAGQLANIYPRQERFDWITTSKFQFMAIKQKPLWLLVKPRTYISEIGNSVNNIVNFYIKSYEEESILAPDGRTITRFGDVGGEEEEGESPENQTLIDKIKANLTSEGDLKFELKNLYIVCYDTSISLGKYLVETRPFEHPEIQKISQRVGDDKYWKVRVGVGGGNYKGSLDEFLRVELDDVELATLRHVADLVINELDLVVEEKDENI